MKPFIAFATLLTLAATALAQSKTFEVIVEAGKHDRVNVPVRVPIAVPAGQADAKFAVVTDAAGKNLPAAVTPPGLISPAPGPATDAVFRELSFILSELKAGQTATFKVSLNPLLDFKTHNFTWHDTVGVHADLKLADRPVLRYMYAKIDESSKEARIRTFKPFHHVFDPDGKQIITNGPDRPAPQQFPHHRGLYYGFNKTSYDGKNCDTWHCTGDAHQVHQKFSAVEVGPVLARHRAEIGWHGVGKELFAVEERELTVYDVPGGTLIDFASKLTPKAAKVKLDGDPQHAGFHFRAENEVAAKTKGETYFLRPHGKGAPGQERNWPGDKAQVNLAWNVMSFVIGGQRYSAAYLDKPSNPKEARWSERTYGRFGHYFVAEVEPNKPLLVNYRIWLQKGEMSAEQAAALQSAFAEPPTARVK